MKVTITVQHEIETDDIERDRDYRSFCGDNDKYFRSFHEGVRKCSLFGTYLDTPPNEEYTDRCDECLKYTPDVRRY